MKNKKVKQKIKPKAKQKKKSNPIARQLIAMPEGASGVGVYADWLEVSVWAQSDGQISRQDVIAQFAITEEVRSSDDVTSQAEEMVAQIWYEIKTRILELKEAYPFRLSDNEELFLLPKDAAINTSYIFCLLISIFSLSKLMSGNTSKASNLFESLCTFVAHKYLADDLGESGFLQFGAPRSSWEKATRPLPKAIDELIKHVGEGTNKVGGIRVGRKTVADGGDGGLDIVAWRKFPDKRLGYLLFFGQCATAKDYAAYLSKLADHQNFLLTHLSIDLVPVFGFFLPHSLTPNDDENKGYWEQIKRTKNIPFDRNRIALYGSEWSNGDISKYLIDWRKRIQKENTLI